MKTARPQPLLLLAVLTLALTGCKPDSALKKGEVIDKGTQSQQNAASGPIAAETLNATGPAADVTQLGAVQGAVHFNGQPPARVPIDMSADPGCALASGKNLSEQIVASHGKLANVFVYVKAGAANSNLPAGSPPVVLDQQGCRYTPHVIAVQQGGSVEFRNSDPTMHNIHTIVSPLDSQPVSNQAINFSQAAGAPPQIRQFTAPEIMIPVRCDYHPWMNAFINVAPNPYFAVTNADGNFSIAGLPPGVYTLAAIHETLGEQDLQITVPAKSKVKADFSFAAR